jgi:hypothetical protein
MKIVSFADLSKGRCVEDRVYIHEAISRATSLLLPEEHSIECPVHHHASQDCCWPLAICVPDSFNELEATYPSLEGSKERIFAEMAELLRDMYECKIGGVWVSLVLNQKEIFGGALDEAILWLSIPRAEVPQHIKMVRWWEKPGVPTEDKR